MTRHHALALLAAAALFPAAAVAAPTLIRGTIETASPSALVIHERDGGTATVAIGADTHYGWVVPSSLDAIKPDDFIGTATKGPSTFRVALEVLIFPASMRGTGEGQYPWSRLPDTTLAQGGGASTGTTMTNGTVSASAPAGGAPRTATTMTNGTVTRGTAGDAGRTLTVNYGGGRNATIIVPPTATIVRLEPADRAAATQGGAVFIKAAPGAGGALDAQFVAVGKGVVPPM